MAECRIGFGVVGFNRPDLLEQCLESIRTQRGFRPPDLALVKNHEAAAEICSEAEFHGAMIFKPGLNIGLPAAMNWLCSYFFGQGYGAVLIVNEDLVLKDDRTRDILEECYRAVPRQLRYLHGRGYSAVSWGRPVWDEVGPLDEGFFPAFYEDNDHHRRVILAGIPWDEIVVATEHVGSASLTPEFAPLNAQAFSLNTERYQAKWGGLPGHESFTQPWNGGRPLPHTRTRLPADVMARIEARYG